ncbi:MAG: Ig-like domain-containing protein [Taibaiella sp.]|nr:Ig-like domain-containing protein [Taibaiella sp.]
MKKLFTCITLLLTAGVQLASAKDAVWTRVAKEQAPAKELLRMPPSEYLVYKADVAALKAMLWALPQDYSQARIMELPMPDGSFRAFRVWETPMMPASLAAQYPDIRTFTAEAVDNKNVTAKFDFTELGFHAVVLGDANVPFIDPYDNLNDGYYVVHNKATETRPFAARMICAIGNDDHAGGQKMETLHSGLPATNLKAVFNHEDASAISLNGTSSIDEPMALTASSSPTPIRRYDLALSANNFYCQAATGFPTPTIGQCLSAMTTSMNRVNGVYNRELSVQMNFVATENLIIWPTATGSANGPDPFNAINSNASSCLTQNQTECDTRIGSANYDIGHVFTTGAGGLASVGVVCNNSFKARGVTGSSVPVGDAFDIDYVCHEMGHQFGSSHTFNNNVDGSCSGNASMTHAYEPASGITIMDYAGICSPDNVARNSSPYFSANSLEQIVPLLSGSEGTCASSTPTTHPPVTIGGFIQTYNIPYKTPFELAGPTATGSGGDTAITYGWYQNNLGDFGLRLNQTHVFGPLFRSYQPVYTNARVFPANDSVIIGVYNHAGERMADTARYMTFKTVIRNIAAGMGAVLIPDDTVHLNVSSTGAANGYAGFVVTSQGTTGIVYTGGSTQTVTWNVVGTNLAPVSAANVDIFMSVDGGRTWPYTVGTFPNTGTASITVPNPAATSTTARFKVKGSGNVFFNINSRNFTVNPGTVTAPITGTFTVCVTSTTALADATPSGTWSSSTPSVATVNASGVVTGVAAGTSTITYTAASGAVTAVVTVLAVPAPGATTGSSLICMGTPESMTNGTPSGVWSSSNTSVATVSSGGVVTGVAPGTADISYTVTNGCGSGTAVHAVTVGAVTAVASITGATSVCPGSSTTLGNTTPSGVWSSSNPAVATISSTGDVTGVAAGTTTISYTVTNASGCVSAATVIFTVGSGGSLSVSVDPMPNDTVCTGQTITYVAVPAGAGPGATYQWIVNGIPVATGPTFTTTPANGDMVVVQMTATGACSGAATVSSTPITITVQAPLTNTVDISASATSIGAGDAVTFAAIAPNAGPAATYQWYVNATLIPGATNTTFTTTELADGQMVHCKVTSVEVCVTPKSVLSGGIVIHVASGINDMVGISSMSVVPNPTKGTFIVKANGVSDGAFIVVSNLLGQQVLSATAQSKNGKIEAQLSLPTGVARGIYFLTMTAGNEKVVTRLAVD